jgi:hypothetical protein
MTKTSTHHLLLLYLFNELSPADRNCFEHLLLSDADLQRDYHEMLEIKAALHSPLLTPSERLVRQLMDYADRD